jgi:hypothetical protein
MPIVLYLMARAEFIVPLGIAAPVQVRLQGDALGFAGGAQLGAQCILLHHSGDNQRLFIMRHCLEHFHPSDIKMASIC